MTPDFFQIAAMHYLDGHNFEQIWSLDNNYTPWIVALLVYRVHVQHHGARTESATPTRHYLESIGTNYLSNEPAIQAVSCTVLIIKKVCLCYINGNFFVFMDLCNHLFT